MPEEKVCPYCGFANHYARGTCIECSGKSDGEVDPMKWRARSDAAVPELSRIADAVERNAKATEGILWFLIISAVIGLVIAIVALAPILL